MASTNPHLQPGQSGTDWAVIEGDCRAVLATLPERSVHTCVTSPPYFGLRDYGHAEQRGAEATPDEFVAALVEDFRAVRRALRDDGTVWLNLGDSYASSPPGNVRGVGETSGLAGADSDRYRATLIAGHGTKRDTSKSPGCKPKDLVGIPWMVAFALRADGWYLRSEIIWHKPNPMPESVRDRPTKAHEQVFLLSKGPRYFYDADAVREPATPEGIAREGRARLTPYDAPGQPSNRRSTSDGEWMESGRNKRTVWTVATQPYAGAHFATFPPKLIEPCILAGCPERCCSECGAPWKRLVESNAPGVKVNGSRPKRVPMREGWEPQSAIPEDRVSRTAGFEPSCDHGAPAVPGTVLDPFAGAGTTGIVALRHGRSFVGIELSADYAALARERIRDDSPLLNGHAEAVV